MSIRRLTSPTVSIVENDRFKAVLSIGVGRNDQPKKTPPTPQTPPTHFPLIYLAEIRNLTLSLLSNTFAEKFYTVSAYCSSHRRACDKSVWLDLMAKHDVPREFIDLSEFLKWKIIRTSEGFVYTDGQTITATPPEGFLQKATKIVSIDDSSRHEEIANYLRIVANSTKNKQVARIFAHKILEDSPKLFENGNPVDYTDINSLYAEVVDQHIAAQSAVYLTQMKAIEFVISENTDLFNNQYSFNRSRIKNSLAKGVQNSNTQWLNFVWENLVTPEYFRNGDLGIRLYQAHQILSSDSIVGSELADPVSGDPITGRVLRRRIKNLKTSAWVFDKILTHNLDMKEFTNSWRWQMEVTGSLLLEAEAMLAREEEGV